MPAAFGLAGQNLHTYGGWGSIPYWNAYVANTQMYGKGTFFDPRLGIEQFPLTEDGICEQAQQPGHGDVQARCAALLSAVDSCAEAAEGFVRRAGRRARARPCSTARRKCATCHVPPLFSEPGWPMHTAEEIGIDDFQASRSPDKMYRTTPLAGCSRAPRAASITMAGSRI